MIFNIGGKFYVFTNYSLTKIRNDIMSLKPSLSLIQPQFTTVDFDGFSDLDISETTGFEDLNSMLEIISKSANVRREFSKILDSSSPAQAEADLHVVSDTVRQTVNNIFIQILSSITSPILSFIFLIVFFLSLLWGIIWSILFLKCIVPRIYDRGHFTIRNDNLITEE